MTDETMNNDQSTDNQAMFTQDDLENRVKNRLAQQSRHHEKALSAYEQRISDLENRLNQQSQSQSIGQQAGESAISNANQALSGNDGFQQQQSMDPVEMARMIAESQRNYQQEQEQQKQQKEYQDALNNSRQSVISQINESAKEDPEFNELLQKHAGSVGENLIDYLAGSDMPAGVAKHLLMNDDIRDKFVNAKTHLDQLAAVKQAERMLGSKVMASNMSRGANRRISTQRGQTSDSIFDADSPSDFRRAMRGE